MIFLVLIINLVIHLVHFHYHIPILSQTLFRALFLLQCMRLDYICSAGAVLLHTIKIVLLGVKILKILYIEINIHIYEYSNFLLLIRYFHSKEGKQIKNDFLIILVFGVFSSLLTTFLFMNYIVWIFIMYKILSYHPFRFLFLSLTKEVIPE